MSKITTETRTADTVETPYQDGWNPAQWLYAHKGQVVDAAAKGNIKLGNGVATTWPTTEASEAHVTWRAGPPPESDEAMLDRHFDGVALKMVNFPPVP